MADQTTTTTNIQGFAPQIAPYVEGVLGGAAKAVATPYQSYADWARAHGDLKGDQVAAYDKLQNTAYTGAEGLTPEASSIRSAQGLESLSQRAGNVQYAPTQFGNQFQAPGAYQAGNFGYQNVGTQSFAQPGSADAYMSPYMQSVVDIQKREAQRQSGIQGTQQQAQAAQAGAFGGGRDAIMRAERERNLGQQMGDIQATGSQAAFQQAQQQFNAEQQARLQAQLANQQAGLTTQQQQEQAKQFGYGQGMQSAALGAQYGLAGQQEAERSKQFGANLGLQGLQAGIQGYGALGSQGQNLYGQTTGNLQLQNAFGTQKQQQAQNLIDTSQQNYAAEQNYPYKQIGFMSDIINRQPVSNLGSTITSPPPSLVSQAVGLGGAAVTGSKLFGKAEGGQIKQHGAGLSDLAMYQMSRG
jgi:hypothetical protein